LKGRRRKKAPNRPDAVSEQHRLPTLWTNSYSASTVGGAPLATIKRYIENQKGV
jgi:putative transposase